MVARGLRGRCPRCGSGGVFRNFFDLHERCPSCGLKFEREPGYWVGAMVIITAVTVGVFITVLVGGIALTWPEVPWGWLLGVTVGANLVVPVLGYPRAKTTWAAFELGWHPLEPEEIRSALEHTFQRSG